MSEPITARDALVNQVRESIDLLLAAIDRDGSVHIQDEQEGASVYEGILGLVLSTIIALYGEDRGLAPDGHASIRELFAELQADAAVDREAMNHRYQAWPRLLAAISGSDE